MKSILLFFLLLFVACAATTSKTQIQKNVSSEEEFRKFNFTIGRDSPEYPELLIRAEKSVKLNPKDTESAWILFFLKQMDYPNIAYDKNNPYLKLALENTNNSLVSQLYLADYYRLISKTSEAISVLENSLKINPDRLETYINLANYSYSQDSNLEKPISYLEKAENRSLDKCKIYEAYQKFFLLDDDKENYLFYLKKSMKENKNCMESSLYSAESSFYLTKRDRKDLFRLASKYADDSKEENKYRDIILPEKQTPTSQKEKFQNEVEDLEKKIKDSKEDEKSKLYVDISILYVKRTNSSRYNKDIQIDDDFPVKIEHYIKNAIRYSQNKEQEANIYYSLGYEYNYWDEALSNKYNTLAFEVYMSMKKDMHSHRNFLNLAEKLEKNPIQLYERITQTISDPEEKINYYLEAADAANNIYSYQKIAITLFQRALWYIKDNQRKADINFTISKIHFNEGNEFQEKGIPFLRKAISLEQKKEEKEFYTSYLEWQLEQNKQSKI